MQKITLFILPNCPYCRSALRDLEAVCAEHPELRQVPIERVDESREPERANRSDYYYVPTFYVGERKTQEGAIDRPGVERVLRKAYEG